MEPANGGLSKPNGGRRLYLSGWFRHRILSKYLAPYDGNGLLLDVGGGAGRVSWHFRKWFRAVIVLDNDIESLRQIQDPTLISVLGDARNLPFKEGSFQRVLSVDFQEHLDLSEIPIYLKEIYRVSADFALAGVFTSCRGFTIRRWLYGLVGRKSKRELDWSDWAKDGHRNRLTWSQHRKLVSESGFRLARWRFAAHFFDPLVRRFHGMVKAFIPWSRGRREDMESLEDSYRMGKPKALVEGYFWVLKWVGYLDCVLFGRIPGGAVFMQLEKDERRT